MFSSEPVSRLSTQMTRCPCSSEVVAEMGAEEAGAAGDDGGRHDGRIVLTAPVGGKGSLRTFCNPHYPAPSDGPSPPVRHRRRRGGALLCRERTVGIAARPWSIERSPFAVELHPAGTRLTTLGGRAPLTYTDTAGHEHALSRVLATRTVAGSTTVTLASPGTHATAELTLHRAAGRIDVAVSVKPRSGVQALRLTLAAPPSAHFVGTGQRLNFVDLRRTVLPLKVWNACGSAAPAPFFASTAGFGAYLVSDAVGRIAFPAAVDDTSFACDLSSPSCSVGPPVPAVRICVKAAAARLEVYAGPPLQTAADYVKRAGLPRAPWLPAFALMKWRDSVSGEAEFLDDIKELRSRGLPIGWLILDNPWEEGAGATNSGCFGTLTFDHSRYPDPGALSSGASTPPTSASCSGSPRSSRRRAARPRTIRTASSPETTSTASATSRIPRLGPTSSHG